MTERELWRAAFERIRVEHREALGRAAERVARVSEGAPVEFDADRAAEPQYDDEFDHRVSYLLPANLDTRTCAPQTDSEPEDGSGTRSWLV